MCVKVQNFQVCIVTKQNKTIQIIFLLWLWCRQKKHFRKSPRSGEYTSVAKRGKCISRGAGWRKKSRKRHGAKLGDGAMHLCQANDIVVISQEEAIVTGKMLHKFLNKMSVILIHKVITKSY